MPRRDGRNTGARTKEASSKNSVPVKDRVPKSQKRTQTFRGSQSCSSLQAEKPRPQFTLHDWQPTLPLAYPVRTCHSPPPAYEEVRRQGKKTPRVEAIVKALALFNGQWSTLDTISKHIESDVNDIEDVIRSHRQIFSMMKTGSQQIVELVPKIGICMPFLSDGGCRSRDTCSNLHICKHFVLNFCKYGRECQFGHRWDTTHNSNVLSKFYLDLIDRQVLHQIIKKLCKGCVPPQICKSYNSKGGCNNGESCGKLHICEHFVKQNGKCSCVQYNHDILTPHCRRILLRHDLSVNDTPRDIIMHLQTIIVKENKMDRPKTCEKGKQHSEKRPSYYSQASRTTDQTSTCKSTDVLGDVEIPEICIFSVNGRCRNEDMGCKYLHAKSLFHWQAKKNQHWYNFRVFQSKILEGAFRNVSNGSVTLPPLDDKRLDPVVKELLSVFGTGSWEADFESMSMTNSSDQECLKIRRISTRSAAVSRNPKATVYRWFFLDDQGKWIQYGKVDSLGKQGFVCNVTSEAIEKQYMSDSTSFLELANSKYSYKIDFSEMRQLNLGTGKRRPVRRRPSGLSYQKTEPDQESALPSTWSPMHDNQTHVLHTLDANTKEFKEVSRLVRMSLPSLNIVKIQRLQNPYLWRLFQYKQADLSRRCDESQMNVQRLFHSIDARDIESVCKENFDWRQGRARKNEFGKGAYFSNRAAYTRQHCVPDAHGHCYMFVAQVIIGSVVKGSPELTRPPVNPRLGVLYDTTVDDVHNASLFVKYDKEDYYPEYLIEFY